MRFDVKWKPTNLLANGKDQDELKKSQISNEAFGGYWLLLLYKGVCVCVCCCKVRAKSGEISYVNRFTKTDLTEISG